MKVGQKMVAAEARVRIAKYIWFSSGARDRTGRESGALIKHLLSVIFSA